MNHRPTDNAIKNTIIIALGNSSFTAYSSLAQRYQQVDHATKPWPELRQDIESLIHNNPKGTSKPRTLIPTTHPPAILSIRMVLQQTPPTLRTYRQPSTDDDNSTDSLPTDSLPPAPATSRYTCSDTA
jgi:hypothetical protein